MTIATVADQVAVRPTQMQREDKRQTMSHGERERRLELAGITTWAKIEVGFVLDHISWTLRTKDWNTHQPSVDRLLKTADELKAAILQLADEVDSAFSTSFVS